MDLEFYVRFSVPDTHEVFNDEQSTKISNEEIRQTLKMFDSKQTSAASDLRIKYNEKIKAIEGKRVLFVGDSITFDRLGYRGIVTKAANLESKNAARSGATSTDMYRFIYENIDSFNPEIVSVMIGTNDAFAHCGIEKNRLVSLGEYRRNIKGIIDNCVKSRAKTVVVTIPTIDETVFNQTRDAKFKENDNKNIATYNEVVREEAAVSGAQLVDLEAALKKNSNEGVFQPDGVHLSFKGQNILADLWLEKVLGKE